MEETMNKYMNFLTFFLIFFAVANAHAESSSTTRIPIFSNEKVKTWKTIIYPGTKQTLKMHRHESNRILVPFNSGELKIVNDKGQVHYLKLEKEKAYYLTKDLPGELHTDENMSQHPIRVMVIELNS